jgi:hypothetical protein
MIVNTFGLVIFALVNILLAPSTELQASTKGLKVNLSVDSMYPSQDVTIDTVQYGDIIHQHDGYINNGRNDITLNYPSGLIDHGPFLICVTGSDHYGSCGEGYNSEAKEPERVYVGIFEGQAYYHEWLGPQGQSDSSSSSSSSSESESTQSAQNNEQSQSNAQSQNNEQTVTIINCPPDSRCVIEQ